MNYVLWFLAEIAIAATDLAEVIGSAVALHLLTGMPIWAGVLVTLADVALLLLSSFASFRILETVVFLLVVTIGEGCHFASWTAVYIHKVFSSSSHSPSSGALQIRLKYLPHVPHNLL